MILLALAGIVFAIVRWRRHPRVSLMTILALVINLVNMLVFTLILYWLPEFSRALHLSPNGIDWTYTIFEILDDFVYAGILILLVAAAFSKRGTQRRGLGKKRCPKCKRTYDDNTLRFCLEDGVALVVDSGSSLGSGSDSTPTEFMNQRVPPTLKSPERNS